jgi:hypothetical protein
MVPRAAPFPPRAGHQNKNEAKPSGSGIAHRSRVCFKEKPSLSCSSSANIALLSLPSLSLLHMDKLAPIYIGLAAFIVGPLVVGIRFLTANEVIRDEWRSQLKQHFYLSKEAFETWRKGLGFGMLALSACGMVAVFILNSL